MPNYLDMDDSLTPGLKGVKLSNGTKYELTYKTLKNKPCFRKDSPAEVYLEETVIPAAPSSNAYLTFSSDVPFILAVWGDGEWRVASWDGTVEYSLDTETWAEWDGHTDILSGTSNAIYLRGTNNTTFAPYDEQQGYSPWVTNFSIQAQDPDDECHVACSGNIETLLDYATVERGEHPMMGNGCFSNLFNECTSLTSAPALPATTLAGYCYEGMFNGCTSLTSAPAFPATTLAEHCYDSMFQSCTALKLSATQTAEYTIPYRIPSQGTGVDSMGALANMFTNTGGTFTGTPTINTTYYLAVN